VHDCSALGIQPRNIGNLAQRYLTSRKIFAA
jgi:hypothetical protein